MEIVTSRQNKKIQTVRELSRDPELRRKTGLFVCDGAKLLAEALRSGAGVETVLWKEHRDESFPEFEYEALLSEALFDYASPLKNSPGPLFTVRIAPASASGAEASTATDDEPWEHVLVLEGVQDPGNVGTVLRTADAFGVDCVVLLEGCADVYAPKTVRSTMGAVFRQKVLQMSKDELTAFCRAKGLKLYAAALSRRACDVREVSLRNAAVCVGSEGSGLSRKLLECCDGEVIIPMRGAAESLNAAVAAAILMWEMCR
jgi:TrmH family RNA methyltransferase